MVECQQAMMLDTALAFEKLIKNPKAGSKERGGRTYVTWDNTQEVEAYIKKLQTVAEKLTTDNRRLRKCHSMMTDKVRSLSRRVLNILGFELVKQNRFAKICWCSVEKGPAQAKNVFIKIIL